MQKPGFLEKFWTTREAAW